MQLDHAYREMLGDDLSDAIDAARERCEDDTILARCAEGRWSVERGGVVLANGLTYLDATATVIGLEAA